MLARGFIELTTVAGHTIFLSIEHIVRVRRTTASSAMPGRNNPNRAVLLMSVQDSETSSSVVPVKETVEEVMTLINKERELIRAMEKAAS